MGIIRLRIALIGVLGLIIAIAAGDIFDQRRWELLLPPVVVAVAAIGTVGRRWPIRLIGAVLAIGLSVAASVTIAGGDSTDIRTAFTAGPQRLLSTDWPSPTRADLIGTVAMVLAVLLTLAGELTRRRQFHLTPLVPIGIAHALVIALSAARGVGLHWLLLLGVVAIVFVVFRPGMGLRERSTLLAGERRLVPVTAIAVLLAAALAIPIGLSSRADPRRNDEAQRALTLLDPIEATLALQDIEPPIDLHEIRIEGEDIAAPTRWRTAALVNYDGRRWAPALTLRPIGRRLDTAGGPALRGSMSFLDDDLQLVPLPGPAVTIDTSIETDEARTIVRLAERPDIDSRVDFAARVEPLSTTVAPGSVQSREIDESVSSLSEFAESIVDDATDDSAAPVDVLSRLQSIEATMRSDFVLDSAASGGGLQRALIVRFIRDTRRGNAEQFSTAFVLLARSLGVDARVATGFDVSFDQIEQAEGSSSVTLSSADATVWPEVNVGNGQWLAFDPVPDDEVSDAVPEPEEPQVQTPAAPQPPIAPPPEATEDPVVTETEDVEDSADALPSVVRFGLQAAAVAGALLIPLLLIVLLILGVKWRRRRRRLAGPPDTRIRGAWSVATSRLIDAGMTIGPASTNNEIAGDGVEFAPSAERELHRLAVLASAATFGEPARPDLLAEDANSCLGQVETSMADSRTRWQRLRWRLSLRSLRSSTRSPV